MISKGFCINHPDRPAHVRLNGMPVCEECYELNRHFEEQRDKHIKGPRTE